MIQRLRTPTVWSDVMNKLEIFASDADGEDARDVFNDDGMADSGSEEANATQIAAEKCLCRSHSGDNSEFCKHPYNSIWGQNTPL